MKSIFYILSVLLLSSGTSLAVPTSVTLTTLPGFLGTSTTNTPGTDYTEEITFGDFNCDGTKDLIFGAPGYLTAKGRIYVKFGGSGVTSLAAATSLSSTNVDVTIDGVVNSTAIGEGLLAVDVNDDGCDDIISTAGGSGTNPNYLYLFYGSSSWSGSYTLTSAYSNRITSTVTGGGYSYLKLLGELDGPGTGRYISICSMTASQCFLMPLANVENTSGTLESNSTYRVTESSRTINYSITSCDLDQDGNEDIIAAKSGVAASDTITIWYGPLSSSLSYSTSGTSTPANYFTVGTASAQDINIIDTNTSIAGFGYSIACSNFVKSDDDDAYPDLAIGNYGETVSGNVGAGKIHVIDGASLDTFRDSVSTATGITLYNDSSTGTYNYSNLDTLFLSGDDHVVNAVTRNVATSI